jgi:putative endonuclease
VGVRVPSSAHKKLKSKDFSFYFFMYYVYILQSELNQSYYKGLTNHLERRLQEHNSGKHQSTSRYLPWVMVWHCGKPNRAEAQELEKKLKNITSRDKLEKFIEKYKI